MVIKMETSKIIILIVGIILIIIILGVVGYVIYRSLYYFPATRLYLLHDSQVISLSFLKEYSQKQAGYYALSSNLNQCNPSFSSVNGIINPIPSTDSTFIVELHPEVKYKFALKSSNGYLYLNSTPFPNYISSGKNEINKDDHTMWFDIIEQVNGNYSLMNNGSNIGIMNVPTDYINCFGGQIVTNDNGSTTGYILGKVDEKSSFYIPQVYRPNITYPFKNGDKVYVKNNGLSLNFNCSNNNLAVFSNDSEVWTVIMSSDGLSFALMNDSRSYLTPSIQMENGDYQSNSSKINLILDNNLSQYPSDNTSWFILRNGKLISLLTNSSFYVNRLSSVYCGGGSAYNVYGSSINNGSAITIEKTI